MKITNMPIDSIIPYAHNAKEHPEWQIDQIVKSIQEFGFNDPIAVDEAGIIIEGHGRYFAAIKLGMDEIPVIILSHMTDEQKKAYILAHNKLTMNTGFDTEILDLELGDISGIDMSDFGFDLGIDADVEDETFYTKKIDAPIYEIKGEEPSEDDLVDTTKSIELIEEINSLDIPDKVKDFLICAAQRHNVFNYENIAEYYAHATPEVQRLMENSALVIIDFKKAIESGFVKLSDEIKKQYLEDYPDEA